jgi:hypothetical protein
MSSTESPLGSSYDLEDKGAGYGIVTATKSSFYALARYATRQAEG